jgi:parallel beta-helix repeat protein
LAATAGAATRPPCTVRLSPGDDVQRAVERARVVCLRSGEFRLRRFVAITRDGRVLRGAGPSTVLRLETDTQSPVVVIGDPDRPVPRRPIAHVTIASLRIVGGGAGGPEALPDRPYLTNSALVVRAGRDVTIHDVTLGACRSACLLTERDTRRITIVHADIGGSVWDGVALNRTSDARIVGNTIHDNTAAGISAEHLVGSAIADNVVRDNGTHGLYLSDSYGNTIARNLFARNVLAGVFLACAVRDRDPPVRCWSRSMSADNVFVDGRFVDDRVGYMVGADASAPCRGRGFIPNRSRADRFLRTPRADPRATTFGRCLVSITGAGRRR